MSPCASTMRVLLKLFAVGLIFMVSLSSIAGARSGQHVLSRCPVLNPDFEFDTSTPESTSLSIERSLKKQKAPPIAFALGKDQRSALKTLLKGKPDLNVCVFESSLLSYSVSVGDAELAALLLSHGAHPDHPRDFLGATPLMLALSMGQYEIATLILNHGANPRAKGDRGSTSLHSLANGSVPAGAVESVQEQARLAERLLAKGVKLETRGQQGNSALLYAAMHAKFSLVKVLLDRGANVNARNIFRKTALHLASESNGRIALVKLLLDSGVDPKLLDADGLSAIEIARRAGRIDIAQVIEDFKKH
jgi:ankyrin repeat protein